MARRLKHSTTKRAAERWTASCAREEARKERPRGATQFMSVLRYSVTAAAAAWSVVVFNLRVFNDPGSAKRASLRHHLSMDPWAFDDECDAGVNAACGTAAPGKVVPAGSRPIAAAAPTAKPVEPKDMDLPALRVAELKDLCRARSLPVSGACVLREYHSFVSCVPCVRACAAHCI